MKKHLLLNFTKTISSLLNAGLTVQESLEVCSKADKKLHKISSFLMQKILEGESLSVALRQCSFIKVPLFYTSLVKIGEESGAICEIFKSLELYLEKKKKIRDKTIQALLYPFFILCLTVAVSIFVAFFVFPKLNDILVSFSNSNGDIDDRLNSIYGFVKIFGFVFAILLVFILFCFIARKKSEEIKFIQDKFFLKIPVIGKFLICSCCRDFSFAMKILTSRKINFLDALSECENVISNSYFKREIANFKSSIKNGENIADFIVSSVVFPETVKTWFVIGEKTGDIHSVFNELYNYYEEENSNQTAILTSSVEPVLILFAGGLLLAFVLMFVVPVFSLLGEI